MHLLLLFTYTTCLAICLPLFFPFWHMLYFAPFLILCFYRYTLVSCLWWSLLCGLVVDLFSADTRLGIYAMNYCLTTFCLYRYKFHFFEDRLSTLPTMVFGFTCLSTILQAMVLTAISHPFSFSWQWAIKDLLILPLQVAIYAILAFTLPSLCMSSLKRRYSLFLLTGKRL